MLENNIPGNTDNNNADIPQWQKDMIDERLKIIKEDPQSIKNIESFYEELDREI